MESTLRAAAGAPDLRLIETLAWNGAAFLRLDFHIARLQRSADLCGWTCGAAAVALRMQVPQHAARVRLTMDCDGQFAVTLAPLPAATPVWRLGLARQALQSNDPWLAIKSTNRAVYDLARAALPAELDEVIFQNEHGQVCDGTITTLFFDRGQGMRTPPLHCGLLPGVLRAQMLATGKVREEILSAAELGAVRLWVGNSLRGLIPAIFVDQIGA